MENNSLPILIPIETEQLLELIRSVVKDELKAILLEIKKSGYSGEEPLLNRKEIAKKLNNISLVTLNDWVKHGLPSHKQRGKVFFLYSEVLEYIKMNKPQKYLELV